MKYLKDYKIFESVESEIHAICRKYRIENYTINADGSIDVNDKAGKPFLLQHTNVYLSSIDLTKLPLNFNKVTGSFYCPRNHLTSLEGAPKEVGGGFFCHNNQLTSLEVSPERVGDGFYCDNNKIMNIDGLLWKSFKEIHLYNNPVCPIVKNWINNDNREELIEYFIDLNVIQGDKVIMERLTAFHEEMDLEMEIDFKEVKKNYTIIN